MIRVRSWISAAVAVFALSIVSTVVAQEYCYLAGYSADYLTIYYLGDQDGDGDLEYYGLLDFSYSCDGDENNLTYCYV